MVVINHIIAFRVVFVPIVSLCVCVRLNFRPINFKLVQGNLASKYLNFIVILGSQTL